MKQTATTENEAFQPHTTVEKILDLARWAPSGDNTQPWRFETIDDSHLVVHGFDTRGWCVYDLDGHASQIAIGALLETLSIAASGFGLRAKITRRRDSDDDETKPIFDIHLTPDSAVESSSLIPFITSRCTQRRALKTRPLTDREKNALQQAVGPNFQIDWFEGWRKRWPMARLLFKSAKIRLTLPEAYAVHRDVIEKHARFSRDRIPDKAVGLDPITTRIMHWAMKSWDRVHFFNTYLAGTVLPRIELDFVPGLFCAAHFLILAKQPVRQIDDVIEAGRAVQRFWLTATRCGLQFQPEMTPLIFGRFVTNNERFTDSRVPRTLAEQLAQELSAYSEAAVSSQAVFMGRVGNGRSPSARSLRLFLPDLLHRKT